MTAITPDLIGWAAFLLSMGCGLVVLGWYLGLHDRDHRATCELSQARTELAVANFNLLTARLSLKAARDANRKLAMKAAIASAGVRHG